jgi:hypothetical protein
MPNGKQTEKPSRTFKTEELVGGLDLVDSDFVIIPPDLLRDDLSEEPDARCAFLNYLWRGVEMKDMGACSCYGALLAMTDPFADDMAVTLLKIAARMGDRDALWNLAVMARRKRGMHGHEKLIAELVARAADSGHPTAVRVSEAILAAK